MGIQNPKDNRQAQDHTLEYSESVHAMLGHIIIQSILVVE